jgi:cell division protein FtsL
MSATEATAAKRRRAGLQLTPRAAVLAVVLMALLLYLVVPLRTYVEQRNRLGDLERQTQLLDRQNRQLQQQIEDLNDPEYIERYARECLHMIKPGEIGFVLVPAQGSAAPVPAC